MNVGILTLPFNPNYGGILQGYALQTAVEQLGHRAYHINRPEHHYLAPWLRPIAYAKRLVEQKIQGKNKHIFFEDYHNAIAVNTNAFIRQHIHLWKDGQTSSVTAHDFDALIVGSDQVWRQSFWPDVRQAFLQFAATWDVRRVAYAASFGLDSWQYDEALTRDCKALLREFDAVSLREASGVALCREHLDCEARQMPDPTLLLQRADYERLVAPGESCKGQLFVYLLEKNEHSDGIIEAVARQTGLTPHRMIATDNIHAPLTDCIRPHVESWLKGFADAEMVLTNSFHGCVFSILFGKPFVVVGKSVAGITRISSLLQLFGFDNTFIDEHAEHVGQFTINDPSTTEVGKRLGLLREQGMDFLRGALG